MIHICICDDSDAMRDELCGLIQELCQKHSIAASVSCCSSGEELLFDPDDKNRTTDIFFLDILMKKLNGIETAAKLRAINPTAQIIFLTVSKEHVFEALDVMAPPLPVKAGHADGEDRKGLFKGRFPGRKRTEREIHL